MSLSWFKYEPERTATGYRWLDFITAPYWSVVFYLNQRRMWLWMRIGKETWRQARDRTRRYVREHPEYGDIVGEDSK